MTKGIIGLKRILGVDPGSRMTGFGVIDTDGLKHSYISSGVIRMESRLTLPERIARIVSGLLQVIDLYKPDVSAVEKVFVNVNPSATLILGQARGAALSALVLSKLHVAEYTALQVKQSVVGKGHASKEQVSFLVMHHLHLTGSLQSDAADGLAIALCHAHHLRFGALHEDQTHVIPRRKSSRIKSLRHLKEG
jgi:crossover junction endodeoxyribonuclease RuvC